MLVFQQSLEIGGEVCDFCLINFVPNPFKLQENWLNTLSDTPRVFPYIPESIIEGLEKMIRDYTSDIVKQTFTLNKNSEYTFYTANAPTELTISVAKPFVFDVVLAIMIGGYLAGLYFLAKVRSSV